MGESRSWKAPCADSLPCGGRFGMNPRGKRNKKSGSSILWRTLRNGEGVYIYLADPQIPPGLGGRFAVMQVLGALC